MAKYKITIPTTPKILDPTPIAPRIIPLSDAEMTADTTNKLNPIFFHVHNIHTATKFTILNNAY